MSSPFKLHIHRWSASVKLNYGMLMLSQHAALNAESVYELMSMYRNRAIAHKLPKHPPMDVWVPLYREPRRVMLSVADHVPNALGTGSEVGGTIDFAQAVSAMARDEPDEVARWLGGFGTKGLTRLIRGMLRLGQRQYRRHLESLGRDFHPASEDDSDVEKFGSGLRDAAEFYFVFKVMLPCVIAYKTLPHLLVEQAACDGARQAEAVERLLRLDDMAVHLPEVDAFRNATTGRSREVRINEMTRWTTQGLMHGQFSRAQVKQAMGGLIWALAQNFGQGWSWRGKVPPEITAEQIRQLFHAVARDQSPKINKLGIYDDDLVEMQPKSWQRLIRKQRLVWEQLLKAYGGTKSA